MLLDNYNPTTSKRVNHAGLKQNSPLTFKWHGYTLPTQDPKYFETFSSGELRNMFDEQEYTVTEQLTVLEKYNLITKASKEATIEQYDALYFHDGYAYIKELLIKQQASYTIQEEQQNNTNALLKSLTSPPPDDDTQSQSDTTNDLYDIDDINRTTDINTEGSILISRSAIRNLTGYSYVIQQEWHDEPQTIHWQKELIESEENIVVVDGSRQGGKSLTVAQLLIEESYVPGKDIMVAAFLQETTESIGQYMIEFISNINDADPDTFTIKERKRYIQNNKSGVRIHFRTLKDGAKGIRGKTLRMIVVDEAMLVPTDVFESILLPTQTTIANPRLILLGTAQENKNVYMYHMITAIKRGSYNTPTSPLTARYIKFSINENPLASPSMRANVLMNADNPKYIREYMNGWGKLGDSLLAPYVINDTVLGELSPHGHILIASDPARKQDRSGYSVLHVLNGVVTIANSGEVPPAYKEDWQLQKKFFNNLVETYQKSYQSVQMAIDITGLGDGVYSVFIAQPNRLPITIAVRYTGGDSESEQDPHRHIYTVGKSLLINNIIDFFEQKTCQIPRMINNLLLEEIEHIELQQGSTSQNLIMKSDFYDDIFNSLMIGLYSVKKLKLINKVHIEGETPLPTLQDAYAPYLRNRSERQQSTQSMW